MLFFTVTEGYNLFINCILKIWFPDQLLHNERLTKFRSLCHQNFADLQMDRWNSSNVESPALQEIRTRNAQSGQIGRIESNRWNQKISTFAAWFSWHQVDFYRLPHAKCIVETCQLHQERIINEATILIINAKDTPSRNKKNSGSGHKESLNLTIPRSGANNDSARLS